MNDNLKKQIIYKGIDELVPYGNNPRDNDKAVDAVANSIKEFGFNIPIIIDKDNIIVCGHTRLKAAKKLGIADVPCIIVNELTPEQAKAFRIADNKTAELADWDLDKLAEELKTIEMDMEQFGFDDLKEISQKDVFEDEFNVDDELPQNPYARKGDIFILGKHRLMCGDSTSQEDVSRLLDGTVMDLCVTDPPYNVNYGSINEDGYEKERNNGNKILNDNMDDNSFYSFLSAFYTQMMRVLKSGGAYYIFHSDTEGYNFRKALMNAGGQVKQNLIWVKNSLVLGRQDYQWRHEPCLYGWKEGEAHYFIDDRTQTTVFEDKVDLDKLSKNELKEMVEEMLEDKIPTTIIHEDKPLKNDVHPTMKPIKLISRLVGNSSRIGENVIDFFGGSGSTLIACEQIDRNSYLMELDEKYADVIVNRYLKFVKTYDGCYLIRNGTKMPISDIPDYKILSEDEPLQ